MEESHRGLGKVRTEPPKGIPGRVVFDHALLPLETANDERISLAASDPYAPGVASLMNFLGQKPVDWTVASPEEITSQIKSHYGVGADTIHQMMGDTHWQELAEEKQGDPEKEEEVAVIRFVNQLVQEAYRERATDIHLEPMERSLRIRYRIDGVLHQVPIPASLKRFENAVTSRIKVMAGMDIAEKRLPQDGRIHFKIDNDEIDVRVSTIPTAFGESVSLRLLNRQNTVIGLDRLGFLDHDKQVLRELIRRPHGIILLTGPTGCGKSTTLYSCLSEINSVDQRIVTIEDPIEYQLPGVNQIQVKPEIDFDFAMGLRHILRQDPDVIMVGEIRDRETADIAIRASLTGHLVFSTLHTNDAAGAITRLVDMGIEPFLVASSINAIIAQRLVRTICKECRQEVSAPPHLLPEELEFLKRCYDGQPVKFYAGAGCKVCRNTGYVGRTAIHEILLTGDKLTPLILERASTDALKRAAIERGMITLRLAGLLKAAAGITTVEEVLQATERQEEA
jgi:type II secretory ATPase GspE/PulE/Tfp pilus assembly ATPase PilB-like protein